MNVAEIPGGEAVFREILQAAGIVRNKNIHIGAAALSAIETASEISHGHSREPSPALPSMSGHCGSG